MFKSYGDGINDAELNNWRIVSLGIIIIIVVITVCITMQSMHKKAWIGKAVISGVKPYEARMMYKDNSVANDYAVLIKAVKE